MDIRTDPLVNEIRDLAPEVRIVGGTFAHWLLAPKNLPPSERSGISERARRDASTLVVTQLLLA